MAAPLGEPKPLQATPGTKAAAAATTMDDPAVLRAELAALEGEIAGLRDELGFDALGAPPSHPPPTPSWAPTHATYVPPAILLLLAMCGSMFEQVACGCRPPLAYTAAAASRVGHSDTGYREQFTVVRDSGRDVAPAPAPARYNRVAAAKAKKAANLVSDYF